MQVNSQGNMSSRLERLAFSHEHARLIVQPNTCVMRRGRHFPNIGRAPKWLQSRRRPSEANSALLVDSGSHAACYD